LATNGGDSRVGGNKGKVLYFKNLGGVTRKGAEMKREEWCERAQHKRGRKERKKEEEIKTGKGGKKRVLSTGGCNPEEDVPRENLFPKRL